MAAPTGKLKYAYQTIANMEAKINELQSREVSTLKAIKECFPSPLCTEGYQIVTNENYNKLVDVINTPNKD